MTAACLIFALLVAVVLSVSLTQLDRNQSRGSVEGLTDGSESDTGNAGLETESPTLSPTLSPTSAPTQDAKNILSESYVYNAINQCQGTGSFYDAASPQGEVFQLLINEVYDKAVVDSTGAIAFDELHTTEYLLEKYALSVLYITTNGDSWSRNDNWMSTSDPCVDWEGIDCQKNRAVSSCAVTGLTLGTPM